ncbi:MAG: hypothetical protein WCS42_28015 [Verrucomicrobiota bacterium]
MKDAALHLEVYAPAANANVAINPMDLGVDQPGFSDNWRQGRVRIAWPALPNHTNASLNITVTLQDSGDAGATYANTAPQITVNIPGVAANGAAAGYTDVPLPPGLRGPLGLLVAVPAGAGDNTAALITADWLNE